jgi:MobA/MobL family
MLIGREDEDNWFQRMGRLDEAGDAAIKALISGARRGLVSGFSAARHEPAPRSSRPTICKTLLTRGGERIRVPHVTFHFAHRAIGPAQVKSWKSGRAAAQFQLYIERATDSPTSPSTQREETPLRPFAFAEEIMSDDLGPLSFGSDVMGATPHDRAAFWRALAREEKHPHARVQARLIGELPFEFLECPRLCRHTVKAFADECFSQRGLAYWAVIHRPDKEGGTDPRNLHFHLVYTDRPVLERVGERGWRFGARKLREVRGRTYPWGTEAPSCRRARILRRLGAAGIANDERENLTAKLLDVESFLAVLAQNPAGSVGAGWVAGLRRRYCEIVNNSLLEALEHGIPISRLYDFRSYADAGVPKMKTRHLGSRQTRLERAGIPAMNGAVNRRVELLFEQIQRVENSALECARADALVRATRRWNAVKSPAARLATYVRPFYDFVELAARNAALRAFGGAVRRLMADTAELESLVTRHPLDTGHASPSDWVPRFARRLTAGVPKGAPTEKAKVVLDGVPSLAQVARLYDQWSAVANARNGELALVALRDSWADFRWFRPDRLPSAEGVFAGGELATFERWGTISLAEALDPTRRGGRRRWRAIDTITDNRYRRIPEAAPQTGKRLVFQPNSPFGRRPSDAPVPSTDEELRRAAMRDKIVGLAKEKGLYLDVPDHEYAAAVENGATIDPLTDALLLRSDAPPSAIIRLLSRWKPHSAIVRSRDFVEVPPDRVDSALKLGALFDRRMQAFYIGTDTDTRSRELLRRQFPPLPSQKRTPFVADPTASASYQALLNVRLAESKAASKANAAPTPAPNIPTPTVKASPQLQDRSVLKNVEPNRSSGLGKPPPAPSRPASQQPPAPVKPLSIDSRDPQAIESTVAKLRSLPSDELLALLRETDKERRRAQAKKNPMTVTASLIHTIWNLQAGEKILRTEIGRRGLAAPQTPAESRQRTRRDDLGR